MDTIPTAWRGHRNFANWLVTVTRPKLIVDLGVDYGFSTLAFAEPGIGTVIGIDTFEGDEHCGSRDTLQAAIDNRNRLGRNNVILLRGWFHEINKHWVEPIDILHIDGRHKYEDVKTDYDMWCSFMRGSGVVLFHDTNVNSNSYSFGVKEFFDNLPGPKFNFLNSYGLGVSSQDSSLIAWIADTWDVNGNFGDVRQNG